MRVALSAVPRPLGESCDFSTVSRSLSSKKLARDDHQAEARGSNFGTSSSPSRRLSPQSKKVGGAPRQSYRGLAECLEATECASERWRQEEWMARCESRSLRSLLLHTQVENEELAAAECSHRCELRDLRTEATEVWAAHETPLRQQEVALRSSLGLAATMEESIGAQDLGVGSLRQECQALGNLSDSLENEVFQGRNGHATIAVQVDKGRREVDALEARVAESEERAQELDGLARARGCHRRSLADEATAEQLQIQGLQQELLAMDTQHASRINGWARDTAVACQSLAVMAKTLETELEQGRQLLETHARESSLWREQVYRQESALAVLHGTDVANGIRSLVEACTKQCKSPAISPSG